MININNTIIKIGNTYKRNTFFSYTDAVIYIKTYMLSSKYRLHTYGFYLILISDTYQAIITDSDIISQKYMRYILSLHTDSATGM